MASTSQRRATFPAGWVSFRFENQRVLGPDIPSHCRPAFFICIQCRRHPRLEPSPLFPPPRASRTALCLRRRLDEPTYHRNIVNMAAHRNYRTDRPRKSRGEGRRKSARATCPRSCACFPILPVVIFSFWSIGCCHVDWPRSTIADVCWIFCYECGKKKRRVPRMSVEKSRSRGKGKKRVLD